MESDMLRSPHRTSPYPTTRHAVTWLQAAALQSGNARRTKTARLARALRAATFNAINLVVGKLRELHQMAQQASLQRLIAVDRNRQADDAARLSVM
jgi:hypothetical protein